MFLFVEYLPNIQMNDETKETKSYSKMVIGTTLKDEGMPEPKMLKVNEFEGDQADLMYGMLVGLDENGEVKNVEKENK